MKFPETIATIGIRILGASFLATAIVELLVIAADFICIKVGFYPRSEVAFVPRVMVACFYGIAAAYFFYQSQALVRFVIAGLRELEIVNIVEEAKNE